MRTATRIIVGVTAGGWTGRWIVFGFGRHRYTGLGNGCMPASVTVLSPMAAVHPRSAIPHASCGPPSPRGTEYVLWNGTDHQLYEEQYPFQGWRLPLPPNWGQPLAIGSGPGVRSAPSVVIRSNGERDVFFWGPGRELWTMSYTGVWHDATAVGEAGKLGSSPSAALDSRGVLHVFWRGTDGWLWGTSEVGDVWSTATLFNSDEIGSAATAVVRPDDKLDVFWLGKRDRKLWEMHDPGSQQLPSRVPGAGTLGSAPAAVLDTHGVEHVFWRGTNRVLWELSGPGRGHPISAPVPSGALGSAPSAVVHASGVQDVFWRGTGGGLREVVWYSKAWHPRLVQGAVNIGSQPVAALSPDQSPGNADSQAR